MKPAASRWNSRSIRSKKPASARPPGSIATSPIWRLVEVLYGYPLDGVVLTIGCDKTTPACLMAAATVNIPAIALSVGPDAQRLAQGRAHRFGHDRVEGTRVARDRRDRRRGLHQARRVVGAVDGLLQHDGHGDDDEFSLAEALGMQLPGSAAIPAPYRDRQEVAYRTGKRIVDMVAEDLKPSRTS